MKKVMILFAAILAFTAASFAQTSDSQPAPVGAKMEKPQGHKGKGKHMKQAHTHMKKELNLSADQDKRMKEIGNTYKGKIQAIRTDNALSKEQKKAQLQDVQKSHDAEVKGVLSAEQYTKFTDMKKQRRDNMKGHAGKGKRVKTQ
ncbi:MAG: hypothetical protein JNL70_18305 [Saprospiraceae bacterium]|nr:hypothetical protein [Saprospiraceae bacterium]